MRIVAPIYYDVLRIALKPTMPSFQGRYSGVLVFGVAPSAGTPRYVRCEARGPETLPRVRIRYDGENEKGCPMPDIALRFDKDMLVVSAPVSAALARQGVDVDRDLELMTVLEPDSIQEAMRLESMAGANVLRRAPRESRLLEWRRSGWRTAPKTWLAPRSRCCVL